MKTKLILVLLFVAFASSMNAQTLPSGHYGKFEFTNGSLANASTNGGPNLTGTFTSGTDRNGNVNNAVSTSTALTGHTLGASNYNDTTLSFWMKNSAIQSNFAQRIIQMYGTGGNGYKLVIGTNSFGIDAKNTSNNTGVFVRNLSINLSDGNWHHIAVRTKNVSISSAVIIEVFIDNVLQNSIGGSVGPFDTNATNTFLKSANMQINPTNTYLGSIDDLYLYKSALTNAEISSIYNYTPAIAVVPPVRRYVNHTATGSNDGTSWANAYSSLATALADTNNSDEIWIAKGTYKPHITDRNIHFKISKENLKIYGGFTGTETTLNQRVFGTNKTILSGDLLNNDANITNYKSNYSNSTRNTDNSHYIIKIEATGNNLLLDGVTISDAHNNLSGTSNSGGAIFKEKTVAKLTLKNCIIKDNLARNGAAGLVAEFDLNNTSGTRGKLIIENCQFINNMARHGTCIYSYVRNNTNVDITIANSLFDKNIAGNLNATTAQGISGSAGWIRMVGNTSSNTNLNFTNNTLVNNLDTGTNSVSASKHAVFALSKSSGVSGVLNATISNSIFWNNKTINNFATRAITNLYKSQVNSVQVYNSIDELNFNDTSITSRTHTNNTNPLFTSATDFTLQTGSPANNTGDNAKIVGTTDLAGNTRILNTTVDMGAYESSSTIITSTTWTGATNKDWHTATNWTNGVPTATIDAVLPGTGINFNYPEINNSLLLASVKDLEIQTQGGLTVHQKLTIAGNLQINGSINIFSTSNSNGSLIYKGTQQTGFGIIIYHRDLIYNKWHLISTPIVGQRISLLKNYVPRSGVKYAIADYDNSLASSRYAYYTSASGTKDIVAAGDFVVGKGYSIKKNTASTIKFTGKLNTSDVSIPITDGSATGNKWNLIGNPFTASIKGNENADITNNFLTVNANQLDPARVAMYVWNASNNSYDIINNSNASKYIAPGQGFFVEAKNGGGNIQFTEAMQSHQTGNIFSRKANETPSLKITITQGKSQKSTEIKYLANTSIGLDAGYDAGVFSGDSQSFNVFTNLVSSKNKTAFALQCLPNSNYESMVIPLGIASKTGNEIVFSAKSLNLPNDTKVYLEDKLNNSFTQIDQKNHTVTLAENENKTGRFYVHTATKNPAILNTPISSDNKLNVFLSENTLKIFTNEINQKASVKIFNLIGKEVFTQKFTSKGINEIVLPKVTTGVYIVHLITDNEGTLSKKISIK